MRRWRNEKRRVFAVLQISPEKNEKLKKVIDK